MKRSIGIILATVVLASSCYAQQNKWVKLAQMAGSQFYDLYSVDFIDSLKGWCGGDSIYRTTDGGFTWTAFGVAMIPQAISMADSLVGWAAGYDGSEGRVYKTTDGGVNWTKQLDVWWHDYVGTATLSRTKNITAESTSDCPPCTSIGKIAQTTDSGLTWQETTAADSIQGLTQVQFVDSLHGWIVRNYLGQGGLLRTVDGARSWKFHTTPQNFAAVSFRDSLTGFAVGAVTANVWKTTDGGQNWLYRSWVDSYNGPIAEGLSFVDTSNGWCFTIVFYQGDLAEGIYRTTDGGLTWRQESVGLTGRVWAGQMLDTLHGWAVCDGGVVLGYRPQTTSIKAPDATPTKFLLDQNYPNPFNPTTTIQYALPQRSSVTLTVYNTLGQQVATLVNESQNAGYHEVKFDGSRLVSGVYFYRLRAREYVSTKRLVLVR